ncbi:spore coat putative kinase YutH [Mesobacillus zeae]|uniref:Spore coat protein YutH n=1 Tax=Mesobacillus zeae TaxID=1917180 RepID=A0A398BGV3_9BACI|nr:spore coat protein YutH [Mesobacillus zeae]RID88884.1 spore coat protein YutH [Mesobacillus zeae]
MFEKMLKENYGIKAGTEIELEGYRAIQKENSLYLIMQANHLKEQEISELSRIALQLQSFGDREVPLFLKSQNEREYCEWENNRYSVLQCSRLAEPDLVKTGRKLAKFHLRGRHIPFQVTGINRIGQWKQLWEQRVDQMEKVWNERIFQEPENGFERMFLDSFPYYMGIAENSIQYLVDTELDLLPQESDSGAVCHERFTRSAWGTRYLIKNPFDWVFDHPGRDLAEWVREHYFRNIQTSHPEIRVFMSEYRTAGKLTPFSWRLLYARLMFPLHYFECIENYYMAVSEQARNELDDSLKKFLNQSSEHERFLSTFYQLCDAPVRTMKLPVPGWLAKQPVY